MVIYSAGLRVSEAAALKTSHIDLKSMRVFVDAGKGGKDGFFSVLTTSLILLQEAYPMPLMKPWRERISQKKYPYTRFATHLQPTCWKTAHLYYRLKSCSVTAVSSPQLSICILQM